LRPRLPVHKDRSISGNLLHTLAARKLIQDLEEGTSYLHPAPPSDAGVKAAIVSLGTTFGLASRYTSFLAIEERSAEEKAAFDCHPAVPDDDDDDDEGGSFLVGSRSKTKMKMKSTSLFAGPPKKMSKNRAAAAPFARARNSPPTQQMAPSMASSMDQFDPVFEPAGHSVSSDSEGADNDADVAEMDFVMENESKEREEKEEEKKEMAIEVDEQAMRRSSLTKKDKDKDRKRNKPAASAAPAPPPPTASASTLPPSSPARSAVPQNPRGQMTAVLSLQSTKGPFTFSVKLAAAVNLSFEEALKPALDTVTALSQVSEAGLREQVWATVVALVFLKKRLGQLAPEWELVDKKARKWLGAQNIQQLDTIFSAAEGLF